MDRWQRQVQGTCVIDWIFRAASAVYRVRLKLVPAGARALSVPCGCCSHLVCEFLLGPPSCGSGLALGSWGSAVQQAPQLPWHQEPGEQRTRGSRGGPGDGVVRYKQGSPTWR